jgi:succinate dehydrogenase/fumarate reductase-like Fe-S protein
MGRSPNGVEHVGKEEEEDQHTADAVWRCRTTFNCTDACPGGIEVTKAIHEVKPALLTHKV